MRYLSRRAVHGVFLLAGVSFLSFALTQLAPGEFFDEMRLNPQISAVAIASLRAQYGLDHPLFVKYIRWIGSVVHGDWGYSFAYNSPARPILIMRARNTLILTGTAALFSWLLAIPLGAWGIGQRRHFHDAVFRITASTLLAIPDLLLALAFLLFAVRTGYFPAGGMVSQGFDEMSAWGKVRDLASHLVLPASCLIIGILPVLVSHVRSAMAEVWASPFLSAARGLGISRSRLLFRHALPAAANPIVSLFGFSIGTLLSSSLLVEVVLSWPGLGQLLLEAILQRDVYLVIGATMISTGLLITGNLVADALLYMSDPRIRVE